MNRIILALLLLIFTASCDYSSRCIEADEFGAIKVGFDIEGVDVKPKYTSSEYTWFFTSAPVESGYVLNGNVIVAKLDGVWSPWTREKIEEPQPFASEAISNRVCTLDDFVSCNAASTTNNVADTCMQPIRDSNGEEKICWYAEGLGLYVALSSNPTESTILYFHLAEYFETQVSGYQNDWYFVLDPTTVDIGGNSLLEALSVNDYEDIKVWTRRQIYTEGVGNISGDLAEVNLNDGSTPDKLNIEDGDFEYTDAVPTLTFYSGVKLGEPVYTQNAADVVFGNAGDIIKGFFESFVGSTYLRNLINVSLALLVSYFGIAFFLGLTRFSNQEMLMNVMRVGIVLTIVNGADGWDFYNEYFVKFVWNGSQQIATEIMVAVNAAAVATVADLEGFKFISESQSTAFLIVDDMLKMFLANDTHTKIWAIGISHYFGIFIILLIYLSLFYFLLALVKFSCQLIFVFFTMIVLLGIGPIMFLFLLFGFTREFFMKWIQNLISVFLQPVLFLVFFGPFATLATFYLYKILYLQVCFDYVCCEPIIPLFKMWTVKSSYTYDEATDEFTLLGYYDPNYYDIFMLFLIAALLNYLTDEVSKIAVKLSGGFSFAGSISSTFTQKFDSFAIGARNLSGGAAVFVAKGAGKVGLVKTANVLGSVPGFKSLSGMVSGSRQSNFLKAQKNVKNNLRNKGYSDAEISELMKSDTKVQGNFKEELLRLNAKSDERYTVKGMVKSIASDAYSGQGYFSKEGSFSALSLLTGLKNRAMSSYKLSKAKDFRSKKMSKAERQRLSDKLSGTGRYRDQYMKDKSKIQEAEAQMKKFSDKKENKKIEDALYEKDLGAYFKRKSKQTANAAKGMFKWKVNESRKDKYKLSEDEQEILDQNSKSNSGVGDTGSERAPIVPPPSAPPKQKDDD